MSAPRVVSLLLAGAAQAALAYAHPHGIPSTPGPLVSVSVEVDGEPASLYPAPDGSDRFYLEAREGRRYSLTLANRSGRARRRRPHGRRPERDQRHPRRGPRAHVRPRSVAAHEHPRLAQLAPGRARVHLRGRAGLLRGPLRQGEPQDGVDRAGGLSRARRRRLPGRRDRPLRRGTNPSKGRTRRQPTARDARRRNAPIDRTRRPRPRPRAAPSGPIPAPAGAAGPTTRRCSSTSSPRRRPRRRSRCATSTGRRSWPSASFPTARQWTACASASAPSRASPSRRAGSCHVQSSTV